MAEQTATMVLVDVVERGFCRCEEHPRGLTRVVPWMSELDKFPELEPLGPLAELVTLEENAALLDEGSCGASLGAAEVPLSSLRWLSGTALTPLRKPTLM